MIRWTTVPLALREVRRNLLRSFLTTLGIVIGVAAVVTMVTLGNGATRAISDRIASLGSNLLLLRPGQRLGPGRDSAGAPDFNAGDVAAIRNQVSGVRTIAPTASHAVTVVYRSQNWSTTVTGSTDAYFEAGNWRLASGRIFSDTELLAGRPVCILGETVRQRLFGAANPVGSRIRVKQFACDVIGLLASKGQASLGRDQDDAVVVPLHTLQRRLSGNRNIGTILISVADGASTAQVTESLERLMRERRRIASGEEDNFSILDTQEIAETLSGTTRVMTMLLGSVAAVSLLVGGIGIMNIMLVSVTERTREIGIRLAVGALEREVLLQFLVEAVVLSSLGGLLGVAVAAAASVALTRAMSVPYVFDAEINAVAFAFSAAIGVLFGYFPARRAARLDPIEALRHE